MVTGGSGAKGSRGGLRAQLDLIAMQQAIGFGRRNEWHLAPGADQRYSFAFSDWRFDANGFPVPGG